MTDPNVLEMADVTVRFSAPSSHHALRRLNLTVPTGERIALIGLSGSGKSTLARCVAGWLQPSDGSIRVSGPVRMLPQDSPASLNPRWTVRRILREPEAIQGREIADETLVSAAREIGLAPALLDHRPWQLSTGQRQRVAVARILLSAPFSLLILDEPFTGLDSSTRDNLWRTIEAFRRTTPFAIIHIAHDYGWLRRVCDRVIVLEAGAMIEDRRGPDPFSLLSHPHSLSLLRAAMAFEDASA